MNRTVDNSMNFGELGLSPKVLAAIRVAGYEIPTPIQYQAVPLAVNGRDLLGVAQTGTGKTGAFVLPILNRLEKGRARARMPRTLIIEPTRELAAQVVEALNVLNSQHNLNIALLIGGVPFDKQYRQLDQGVDILVATPGRLLDHFERGKLLLTGIEIFVIDEADRLLDMGFVPDIERICSKLPTKHQTLFFSATMPPEIKRFVSTFLDNPARVEISSSSATASTVKQSAIAVSDDAKIKREVLRNLILNAVDMKSAIIFCNRKRDVTILFRSLQRHKFSACLLHGDMDQRERTKMLDKFRSSTGSPTLLIASDVAARGLDIEGVSHVFNFNLPTRAEDYIHRIGRTGRAGRDGTAITLVAPSEYKYLKALEKLIKSKLIWNGDPPNITQSEEKETGAKRKSRNRRQRPFVNKTDNQTDNTSTLTKNKKSHKTADRHKQVAINQNEHTKSARQNEHTKSARQNEHTKSARQNEHTKSARQNEHTKSPVALANKQAGTPTPVGLGDHVPAFLQSLPTINKK